MMHPRKCCCDPVPRAEAQQNRFADLIRLDSSAVTFGTLAAVARAASSTAQSRKSPSHPRGDRPAFAAVTMKSELEKSPLTAAPPPGSALYLQGSSHGDAFSSCFPLTCPNFETDARLELNYRKFARFFDTNRFNSGDSMLERKAIDPLFDSFHASRHRRLQSPL